MSVDLKSLTKEKINEYINSFDTVLFDCDGVLWHQNVPVPQAAETVTALQKKGKQIFYVTNNSTKTREEYLKKFLSLNFPARIENVISSAYLTAQYLKSIKFDKKVYLIGSTGISQELDQIGISHIGVGPDAFKPEDLDFSYVKNDPQVGAVVVGFDIHFNYLKLLRAASYLKDKNIIFIGTNPDEQFPRGRDLVIPGTGSLVKAVETCSEREPKIMGKPSTYAAEMLVKEHKICPERTLMIGDRANSDILFGKRCGFKTLLVLTGCTQLEHLAQWEKSSNSADKELLPEYYITSLSDLLTYLD